MFRYKCTICRKAICKTNANDKLSFASSLTDINNNAAAGTLQITACLWQLVLKLASCSPWRWHTSTETCQRRREYLYVINIVHLVGAINNRVHLVGAINNRVHLVGAINNRVHLVGAINNRVHFSIVVVLRIFVFWKMHLNLY